MSGGTRTSAKPFEQSHLVMAFAGPSYRDQEFYTAQVFSGLFGGGMSSRLFQEVRERRGLCYAIYSSCWALADTGLFGIHAATGPEMMGKLIDVVGEQLVGAAAEKPAEAELARAKAQLKAGLLMGLESSSARAEQMARQLLLFDRLIEPPELIERIDAVTAEAVRELAAKLVERMLRPSVAVVGAGRKGEAFAAHGGGARGACVTIEGIRARRQAAERRGDAMAFLRSILPGMVEAEIHGQAGAAAPSGHGRLPGLGRAQGDEPPASDRVGAAMGARRADALRLPPPPAPVPARDARGSGLRLPHLPSGGRRRCSGGLSISNVRRGVAQAASIGYWIGAAARAAAAT